MHEGHKRRKQLPHHLCIGRELHVWDALDQDFVCVLLRHPGIQNHCLVLLIWFQIFPLRRVEKIQPTQLGDPVP